MLEQPQPVGPVEELAVLVGREAGGDEVPELLPLAVQDGDHAAPGAGQSTCTVDDLAQDGAQVEAAADAQNDLVQP